jgi:hypothetical protein
MTSSFSDAQVPTAPGSIIANTHRIECEIGRGRRAIMLGAVHVNSGERQALRFWLRDAQRAAAGSERFRQNAEARGLFTLPHVVPVHASGHVGGAYYSVTEWLTGSSLERMLRKRGRFSWNTLRPLVLPCLETLVAAHRAGMIHGRVSPANLFVCDAGHAVEPARLMNWEYGGTSVAPLELDAARRPYLAPELVHGELPSVRSDIYGVGALLYRALSGTWPRGTIEVVDRSNAFRHIEPLHNMQLLPSALSESIQRALNEDPLARHEELAELIAELAGESQSRVPVRAARPEHNRWIKPVADLEAELAQRRQVPRVSMPSQRLSMTSQRMSMPVSIPRAASARWARPVFMMLLAAGMGSLGFILGAPPEAHTADAAPRPVESMPQQQPEPESPPPPPDMDLTGLPSGTSEPPSRASRTVARAPVAQPARRPRVRAASPAIVPPAVRPTAPAPVRQPQPVAAPQAPSPDDETHTPLDTMRIQ